MSTKISSLGSSGEAGWPSESLSSRCDGRARRGGGCGLLAPPSAGHGASVGRLAAIRQVLAASPPFPPPHPAVRPCRVHGRCGLWPWRRDVGDVAAYERSLLSAVRQVPAAIPAPASRRLPVSHARAAADRDLATRSMCRGPRRSGAAACSRDRPLPWPLPVKLRILGATVPAVRSGRLTGRGRTLSLRTRRLQL